MTSSWTETHLSDIADIYDGPHATPKKIDNGPVFLGISNLVKGRIDLSNTNHLSEEDFKKWTRRVTPQPEDIVFSYETRLGEVAMIPEGLRCCLGRRMGLLRLDRSVVHPRYMLYYYLSPKFQSVIRIHTRHGSTVKRLALTEMRDFPVILPPIEEQRAIAHILGLFDDKIEVNRRMNETLEATARATFKSWFIDFDPVHAKANGETPYGMDADTADLFPDSFQNSELGLIPSGWEACNLNDICSERKDKNSDGSIDLVLSAVKTGELVLSDDYFTKTVYSRDLSKYKTVLPMNYAYNPSRINIGSIGMLTDFPYGVVSPIYIVFSVQEPYEWFTHFFVRQPQTKLHINVLSSGTVRQSLKYHDFSSMEIVLPTPEIVRAFNNQYMMLRDKIKANEQESATLAELRDTLLPRLISGELRVDDVSEFVGDV